MWSRVPHFRVFTGDAVLVIAAVFAGLMLSSCKSRNFNAENEADADLLGVNTVSVDREVVLKKHRFDLITSTGEKIFAASRAWMQAQEPEAYLYSQPIQCANNVSRIFEMAGLSGYSSPIISDVINTVRSRGGWVIPLPQNADLRVEILERYFGGNLPAGTLISGCSSKNCSGISAQAELGIIGEIDANDHLQVYHNNGFRPENRPWRPHMIPLSWFRQGYQRKWMPTPWISRQRDARGGLVEARVVLPEIEAFDPSKSFVTLAVIPEILDEIKKGQAVVSDGVGEIMPFGLRLQNVQTPEPPVHMHLAECKKIKTNTPVPVHLRGEPEGKSICRLTLGTPLEKVSLAGRWMQVKGICPDGRVTTGYVRSAFVAPVCE